VVVCSVQCELLPICLFPLINRSLFFIDLVDDCICDARLLAHVQRERCTMTSDEFGVFLIFLQGIT
jgi:hypothetical protein